MPEQPEPHSPADAAPPSDPPAPLDYRGRPDPAAGPSTPVAVQALAGFGTWLLGAAGVVGIIAAAAKSGGASPDLLVPLLSIGLFAAVGIGSWARATLGWRGFIPGMLLGFGLTCLVPIGIVAVVCGGGLRHL